LLDRADAEVRVWAIDILGGLADPAEVPALVGHLRHRDARIRLERLMR
jgi:HEAT repeat protein